MHGFGDACHVVCRVADGERLVAEFHPASNQARGFGNMGKPFFDVLVLDAVFALLEYFQGGEHRVDVLDLVVTRQVTVDDAIVPGVALQHPVGVFGADDLRLVFGKREDSKRKSRVR